VISICTPPESHKEIVRKVCESGIKAILCEKPLAPSYNDALSIIKLCRKNGVRLIVNYPRRFDPTHLCAIDLVRKGRLGKIQAVTGYYTKGLFNNGSHFINLLRAFFGKIVDVKNLGGSLSKDFPYESPDFITKHRDAECLMRALDHRNYMLFELDIIGQKGRVCLIEKGRQIKWYLITKDPVYKGYKALRVKKIFRGTFDKMMSYPIDIAIKCYFGKNNFVDSLMTEAVEDIFLIEKILKRRS
jgi:predicted dehydrogenase